MGRIEHQAWRGRRVTGFLWRYRVVWIPALVLSLVLLAILFLSGAPAELSPFIYRVD